MLKREWKMKIRHVVHVARLEIYAADAIFILIQ